MNTKKILVNKSAKGLIFDLDGTLVDTMPLHFEAWSVTSKKFGFNYSKDEFLRYAGMPTRNIIAMLNNTNSLKIDLKEFMNDRTQYFLNNIEKVKLIEPIFDIVKKYYNVLPMAIGTGSSKYVAELIVEKSGLSKYINFLVTADDVKLHKPHPETFLKCAELIKVKPEDCQVFEDAQLGIQAAQDAGMYAVNVNDYILPSEY